MELFLLNVALLRLNKWLLKHDRMLYTKEEIDELRTASLRADIRQLSPGGRID